MRAGNRESAFLQMIKNGILPAGGVVADLAISKKSENCVVGFGCLAII